MRTRHREVSLLIEIIAAVVILLAMGSASARCQDFQTGPIFVCTNKIRSNTDACQNLSPPFSDLNRHSFPNKRIDFKLVVIGQQAALSYLQEHGYLAIRVGVWRGGLRKEDDISIDIDQTDWDRDGDKLINQTAEEGQFTWRTFFYVDLHDAQSISIEIDDGQGITALSQGRPARLSLEFAN